VRPPVTAIKLLAAIAAVTVGRRREVEHVAFTGIFSCMQHPGTKVTEVRYAFQME